MKRIKAPSRLAVQGVSKLGVGPAATTQEGDDTAPRRDPTGRQEDNE